MEENLSKIPFAYDYMNLIGSTVFPTGVHVADTKASQFFRRYLLQKAMAVFRWDFPEAWLKFGADSYFLYSLYLNGSVAVINTDKFGEIPQAGTPSGYNVVYQPYRYMIANPLLQGLKSPIIGEECAVFKCTKDWGGISDLVSYYGDLMALTSQALGSNLINSKLAYLFAANNNQSAESYKKAYDEIAKGMPAVVVDKKLMDDRGSLGVQFFEHDLRSNFIAPDLIEALRAIENNFCTDVGIPNANVNKKERLITDEVNANNVETESLSGMWLQGWKESCALVKDLFGIDISVDWRSEDVADNDDVDSGAV